MAVIIVGDRRERLSCRILYGGHIPEVGQIHPPLLPPLRRHAMLHKNTVTFLLRQSPVDLETARDCP